MRLPLKSFAPKALELRFGFYRAGLDHVQMRADRLFAARDRFVQSPVTNILMCGSSRAPGGLVSGKPGSTAAIELMERIK